jgi:hypothetical protein
LKGFVISNSKNESVSLQRATLGAGLQNRTQKTSMRSCAVRNELRRDSCQGELSGDVHIVAVLQARPHTVPSSQPEGHCSTAQDACMTGMLKYMNIV